MTTAIKVVELPAALHIPVSVLAQMPEKLRVLGQSIKNCSNYVGAGYQEFRDAHSPVRKAYDDANGTANCIVNAIAELAGDSEELKDVVAAAHSAKRLTSAIYKVCGNIHNDDCFKTTFADVDTVNATVAALGACGDEIRQTLRRYGY